MFYSEVLLQKSGPLARVWLSANLERKLSKTHILQSNLSGSVEAIITPTQAPMALRLSGQLLLGVVRIYSRKARYLLDDCNEALVKIKMAFRSSGNNDIPANLHITNREALLLPDLITPYDNLELPPPPDAAMLLSQLDDVTTAPIARKGRINNRDINLQEDFNNSQFLQESVEDEELALAPLDDVDLDLDFGMDLDDQPSRVEQSIEMGRDAASERALDDDLFNEADLLPRRKEGADRESSLNLDFGGDTVRIADDEGDIPMQDDGIFDLGAGDETVIPTIDEADTMIRARISESPLSDVDEEFAKEVEAEYSRYQQEDLYEQQEDQDATIVRRPTQRARKQKSLIPDSQTMLDSSAMREQQANRDDILKPQTFLPRDPYLLALLDMQKNGGFVSNIMSEGRSSNWAPELRGLLSLNFAKKSTDLKRKRDSGIVADIDDGDEQHGASKSPRLEIEEDEFVADQAPMFEDQTALPDETQMEIPADDVMAEDERQPSLPASPLPAFDETAIPIVHPADSGPVSVATKHAVHILRDLFGADAAEDDETRRNTSVVFQDLLPEARTTKVDATKMFFECLVLATKDAIKVEQGSGLGAQIRIRGKRGLWGDWAEREAGGEIAHQDEEQEEMAAPAMPATVSVGA